MNFGRRLLEAMRSLRARVALFLSLAILPLGIIAVVQTSAVVRDAQSLARQDILARTAVAAGSERALLRRAYGAAGALGITATQVGINTPLCNTIMTEFVDTSATYVFAGFATPDGRMVCNSSDDLLQLGTIDDWQGFLDRPRAMINVNNLGPNGGQSVMVATVPVFDPDTSALIGAASVSLPHTLTDSMLASQVEDVELALIDQDGTILSASTGITDIQEFEALSITPAALGVLERGLTFHAVREDGTERLAALVPLIEGGVYVLGLWEETTARETGLSTLVRVTPLFPILMWLVAFGVVFLALDRLILRHLRVLRGRMAVFSLDDPSSGFANLDDPPQEFAQIGETYNAMIDRMLGDRAELAEHLEEKEVLLREVHHRVKNNLQLIASILNMQMRAVADGNVKRVLARVQDRVMSLSTIHKALYIGSTMVDVRADKLISEIVEGSFRMGIPRKSGVQTSIDLDPIILDPDQAVPLSLLANETVTNAMKYLGKPENEPARISVRLTAGEARHVTLVLENTLGTRLQDEMVDDGTGLGARLVEAFVAQLGGTYEITETPELYRFETSFTAFALESESEEEEEEDEVNDIRFD